jgi:hypothetical protein
VIALTVPEVRRLLQALAEPPARRQTRLRWSRWRRAHQAAARRCHTARRAHRHPPAMELAPPVVAVPGMPPLTEAGWAQLASTSPANGRRGQQWRDHHRWLSGILWVMRAGAGWRELPAQLGLWKAVYSRYRQWCRDGTWSRILAVLQHPAEVPG